MRNVRWNHGGKENKGAGAVSPEGTARRFFRRVTDAIPGKSSFKSLGKGAGRNIIPTNRPTIFHHRDIREVQATWRPSEPSSPEDDATFGKTGYTVDRDGEDKRRARENAKAQLCRLQVKPAAIFSRPIPILASPKDRSQPRKPLPLCPRCLVMFVPSQWEEHAKDYPLKHYLCPYYPNCVADLMSETARGKHIVDAHPAGWKPKLNVDEEPRLEQHPAEDERASAKMVHANLPGFKLGNDNKKDEDMATHMEPALEDSLEVQSLEQPGESRYLITPDISDTTCDNYSLYSNPYGPGDTPATSIASSTCLARDSLSIYSNEEFADFSWFGDQCKATPNTASDAGIEQSLDEKTSRTLEAEANPSSPIHEADSTAGPGTCHSPLTESDAATLRCDASPLSPELPIQQPPRASVVKAHQATYAKLMAAAYSRGRRVKEDFDPRSLFERQNRSHEDSKCSDRLYSRKDYPPLDTSFLLSPNKELFELQNEEQYSTTSGPCNGLKRDSPLRHFNRPNPFTKHDHHVHPHNAFSPCQVWFITEQEMRQISTREQLRPYRDLPRGHRKASTSPAHGYPPQPYAVSPEYIRRNGIYGLEAIREQPNLPQLRQQRSFGDIPVSRMRGEAPEPRRLIQQQHSYGDLRLAARLGYQHHSDGPKGLRRPGQVLRGVGSGDGMQRQLSRAMILGDGEGRYPSLPRSATRG